MLTEKEIRQHRLQFTDEDEQISQICRALSDLKRYRVFMLLLEQERISISSIAKILKISVPLASQHITVLVEAKLLQKQRNGKRIYPRLDLDNPLVKRISRLRKKPTNKI